MTFGRLTMAALAAAGLALGGAVTGTVATDQAQAQEAASFSEDKLRSFADAAVKLSQIRSEYEAQLGQAESDQQRQQLQQQTNQRMAQAVQDTSGISIEEYNRIAQASRADQEVAEKVQEYMQEAAE